MVRRGPVPVAFTALCIGVGAVGSVRADEAPLRVSAPATAPADGRTVVPIQVSGGPKPADGEISWAPQLPRVTCADAMVLPALRRSPPSLIIPVTARGKTITCEVSLRGAKASLQLKAVTPPPGLYASGPTKLMVHVSKRRRRRRRRRRKRKRKRPAIKLDAILVAKDGSVSTPVIKRAMSSQGKTAVASDGAMTLQLPGGKAPRFIAVAFSDGKREGVTFVQLTGHARLPVRVERRSKVSVRLAGWWSKTVYVRGHHGKVPIVVPPGVRRVVVHSVRKGTVVEAEAELPRDYGRRIAAVPRTYKVEAGAAQRIIVAFSGKDGRPANSKLRLTADTKYGKSRVTNVAAGMWLVHYRAARRLGRDRIKLRMRGHGREGYLYLRLRVVPGRPAAISVTAPQKPVMPGAVIEGTVVVTDGSNNRLRRRRVTGTVAGKPVTVTERGDTRRWRVQAPTRLPPGGKLRIEWRSGKVRSESQISMRPGPPERATIQPRVDLRSAVVNLSVVDRHGNRIPASQFTVEAGHGRATPVTSTARGYRTHVVVADDASRVRLSVRAGSRVLATRTLQFAPSPRAIVFGAWAGGGWLMNRGEVASPVVSGGLAVRRNVGPVELGLFVGAERFASADVTQASIAGMDRSVDRNVVGVGVPISVRLRYPVTPRLGLSVGGGVVPRNMTVELSSDFQTMDRYTETDVGMRAQLGLDVALWQGRMYVAGVLARARFSDPFVRGRIEAASVFIGYEWWFAQVGP